MAYTLTPAPGTISISGSTITGTGTTFTAYKMGSLIFVEDVGVVGQLAADPTDDESAALAMAWAGATVSGASFEVFPQNDPAVYARRVRDLLNALAVPKTGQNMVFDGSSTTSGDPGAGKVRANSASNPTALYISETDADGGSIASLLASLDDVTNATARSILSFRPTDGASAAPTFGVTGTITDNGAWVTVPVTLINGDIPADKAALAMSAVPSGADFTSGTAGWDAIASAGTDIASGSTINLTNATGPLVNITGTTTITAVTLGAGKARIARAAGAFQLTASSSLIVNGRSNVNYTTSVDDVLFFEGYSGSVVRVWVFSRMGRHQLQGNRTSYVGAPIPTPTISIASPAVVSSTAHGLSAGDPVVFAVPAKMRTATVTIASPGVVTLNSHGFAAGQPIVFSTTGALPTGITAGTTYYVISTGLTSNSFQFSTSVGGSAVNTSGSQSGTHYISATGALPTGITEGTVYYVSTAGLTTNAFQVADTQAHALAGTNSINTSGSVTGTPVYCAYTGNDSNDGLSQTRNGAFLTVQKAWNTACALDLGTFTATIQLADGTYTAGISSSLSPIGGNIVVQGNVTTPSNVFLSTSSNSCFVFSGAISGVVTLAGMKLSGSRCVWLNAPGVVQYHDIQFGTASAYHLQAFGPGATIAVGAAAGAGNIISGGALCHAIAVENSKVAPEFVPITILGSPAFTAFAEADRLGIIMARSMTFTGAATGPRYGATTNGVIFTGGGGASYFPGDSSGSTATGGQYV